MKHVQCADIPRGALLLVTLLLLHLAELPRPGVSIQWQFLPQKSTLCETPDRWFQVISFGFIKHPFPSLIFKL